MKILILISNILYLATFNNINNVENNTDYLEDQVEVLAKAYEQKEEEYEEVQYYNGESLDIIAKKIDKFLGSTMKGKGKFITEYSVSVGLDPYLAAAVMLQETGCYWTCSKLVGTCNNVGGNKGKPSCNGGSYRKFSSLEDGIKFAINKLNSYYKKGKKTPKQINPHYAEDKTWHKKVENYMKKIKKAKVK